MMNLNKTLFVGCTLLSTVMSFNSANAAIALDRTRVIYNGTDKAVSLNITNDNKQLPYLAQGWLENAQGAKINSPLIVLPPVQRVEPGAKSALKVQALPAAKQLPQDRESIFYFNLREIPPRSDKANVLQIALQTRIKLFYRPEAIVIANPAQAKPWQEEIILKRQGDSYQVINPTPYYVTLVSASAQKGKGAKPVTGFKPVMVEPKGSTTLPGSAAAMGAKPVLTYVNDYGGRPELVFNCSTANCIVLVGSDKNE